MGLRGQASATSGGEGNDDIDAANGITQLVGEGLTRDSEIRCFIGQEAPVRGEFECRLEKDL